MTRDINKDSCLKCNGKLSKVKVNNFMNQRCDEFDEMLKCEKCNSVFILK